MRSPVASNASATFSGDKPVTALNRRLCRAYAASRAQQAARRELEDLRAALNHALKEEILENDISKRIELPPRAHRVSAGSPALKQRG